MASGYDVVVVGGGFAAGAPPPASCQAGSPGQLLLEARDRLGGRTWASPFAGQQVEMGGTWVHWHQPYVFAGLAATASGEREPARPAGRLARG